MMSWKCFMIRNCKSLWIIRLSKFNNPICLKILSVRWWHVDVIFQEMLTPDILYSVHTVCKTELSCLLDASSAPLLTEIGWANFGQTSPVCVVQAPPLSLPKLGGENFRQTSPVWSVQAPPLLARWRGLNFYIALLYNWLFCPVSSVTSSVTLMARTSLWSEGYK